MTKQKEDEVINTEALRLALQQDQKTRNPLIHAVLRADEAAVCLILSERDSSDCLSLVNDLDDDGSSALHYACAYNECRLIESLLNAGGNMKLANRRGNTPLHVAVANSALDAISFLLNRDQSLVSLVNQWNETPLHLAAHSGDVNAAKILVQFNSPTNIKDQWNRTALEVAQDHREITLVEFLENPNPNSNKQEEQKQQTIQQTVAPVKPITRVALSKRMEAPLNEEIFLQWLAESEEEVNGKDFYGYAAVHKLAAWNKDKCLKSLLAHQFFDVENGLSTGPDGNSALCLAVESMAIASLKVILNHEFGKTTILIPNRHGIHAAAMAISIGDPEIISLISSSLNCESTEEFIATYTSSTSTKPQEELKRTANPRKFKSGQFQDLARLLNAK